MTKFFFFEMKKMVTLCLILLFVWVGREQLWMIKICFIFPFLDLSLPEELEQIRQDQVQ